MTHEYSVVVQDYISKAISAITKRRDTADRQGDKEFSQFCKGQLSELQAIREYLTESADLETQKYY